MMLQLKACRPINIYVQVYVYKVRQCQSYLQYITFRFELFQIYIIHMVLEGPTKDHGIVPSSLLDASSFFRTCWRCLGTCFIKRHKITRCKYERALVGQATNHQDNGRQLETNHNTKKSQGEGTSSLNTQTNKLGL